MHQLLYVNGMGSSHAIKFIAILIALVVFFILSGCATVKDTIVLVADPDGRVGRVTVTTKGGTSTLASPNTMIEVTGADEGPSAPREIDRKQIDSLFAGSIRALPREPDVFLLYFTHNSTELTAESKSQISEILSAVGKREFYELTLVGHTDTTGSDEYNMKLSNDRAGAVRDTLVRLGITKDRIELRYHGKQDLIVPTGDNVNEPRNRVVEVVVK